MRVDPFPRFPADKAQMERKLTDVFREYAQQLNGLSEGKIAASTNASTAAPTTGTWAQGDVVRNSAPVESGTAPNTYVIYGWECVSGGTPGTWVALTVPTQLWSGGGGGGGTTVTYGTVTFDFGSAPGTNIAQTAVTGQAGILGTSKVEIFMMGTDSTATHNAYEHALLPLDLSLSCVSITAGTGFTAQAATQQRLTGTFTARFSWA